MSKRPVNTPCIKRTPVTLNRQFNSSEVYPEYVAAVNAHHLHLKGIKGQGIKIGILDTGFFAHNEFLAENTKGVKDFTGQGFGDLDSHGTHVQGMLRMHQDGKFYVGVAPEADYYIGKVLATNGGEWRWLADGIDWLVEMGVDVINLSLGGGGQVEIVEKSLKRANDAGILVVAASGNWGENTVGYPASSRYVDAVGSVDKDGNISFFSNTGEGLNLVAIGENCISTINQQDKFAAFDGTSMSTPIVSGVFALYKQAYTQTNKGVPPSLNQLRSLVYDNAKDLGSAGYDTIFGFGMVNCDAAIKMIEDFETIEEPPVEPINEKLKSLCDNLDSYIREVAQQEIKKSK